MTNNPKASQDTELRCLREKIDDLRVKLSLAFDSEQTDHRELIDLQRKIDVLNKAIVTRMRDLRINPNATSSY